MTTGDEPIEIGILIYPEAQRSAIHGLTDLFHVANMMSAPHHGRAAELRVSHCQLCDDGGEVTKVFDTHPARDTRLVALLLPPSLTTELPVGERMGCLPEWMRRQHSEGAMICSICGGAYLLAESELLNGRLVTTH
jgi:transcriptional regulator GlxA family with amidase domain